MAVMRSLASSALVILLVATASFMIGQHMAGAPTGEAQTDLHTSSHNGAQMEASTSSHNASSESAHIVFVLDRSGSMRSISDHVISGFNSFVEEQRSTPGQLRMTLVQFDSQNPREVVFSGRDIMQVAPLTKETFAPRGATPLYDALGFALALSEDTRRDDERMVLVTLSDGQENDSREHTRQSIFQRIVDKRQQGWTFVFLGANQDAFAEGGSAGYGASNTQNFYFDGHGTENAFASVSKAMSSMRSKLSSSGLQAASYDSEDFFEGAKLAEDDYQRRNNGIRSKR